MPGIKVGIIHRSTCAVLMMRMLDGLTPRRMGAELAPVTFEWRDNAEQKRRDHPCCSRASVR
jgi:hypothetical protein